MWLSGLKHCTATAEVCKRSEGSNPSIIVLYAGMSELADELDLKSKVSNDVRVQVPVPVFLMGYRQAVEQLNHNQLVTSSSLVPDTKNNIGVSYNGSTPDFDSESRCSIHLTPVIKRL